jgi:hypothetical protein
LKRSVLQADAERTWLKPNLPPSDSGGYGLGQGQKYNLRAKKIKIMSSRQTARVTHTAEEPAQSASVIPFPLVLSVQRTEKRQVDRPSVALNILLMLLLVLACVIWEAMSSRHDAAHDMRPSPVTSPRAAAGESSAIRADIRYWKISLNRVFILPVSFST